jgi:hypothetical protein
MLESYYIETSTPSFYYDTRADIQAQAMKEWHVGTLYTQISNTIFIIRGE